ncbi:MAG: adenylate/guanylate cyclase domain-containing protein [Candidatus Cloacimonas acidaminovorans]|jgi:class 3 adenylate cyclase|nr:adenylate/guanylate cyclase domain-containing protein [Candidatus Cloacimonas acidaminovorans]
MNVGDKGLFWKEEELLSEAKKILEAIPEKGKVERQKYAQLASAYEILLKQTSKLTRLSDADEKRLNNLLSRLSRYVSPPLYKKITSGKERVELNKTRRVKLTIFFSDIVDFSSHSANMEGEALSAILNSYLEEMTNIINAWGGTLDKYIGDGILVFFGDPDFTDDFNHAFRCVNMALEMRNKMSELQDKWFKLGYSYPLHIRMGIATGYVSVGNFGSSERMDYTIIGSPVNLASRLQALALADQILISHDTWGLIKDHFFCSEARKVKLKGFSKTQLAYEVYGLAESKEENIIVIEDKEKDLLVKYDKRKISAEEVARLIKNEE